MTLELVAAFLAVGAVAGFFAGLLGIGGGAIMTPALVIILGGFMDEKIVVHTAIASSMATIALTTLPGAWIHGRSGAAHLRTVFLLLSGAVGGAFVCAQFAHYASGALLSFMLSLFLLRVSYQMFCHRPVAGISGHYSPPKWLPGAGAAIGGLSSLLGIGGGVFYTPLLTGRGMPIRRAIGTSACTNSPLAFFAALGYIVGGHENDLLPEWSLGYVYLPATICLAVFGMIFAFFGARLTARLPDKILRRIFGTMTALLAARLLLKTAAGI